MTGISGWPVLTLQHGYLKTCVHHARVPSWESAAWMSGLPLKFVDSGSPSAQPAVLRLQGALRPARIRGNGVPQTYQWAARQSSIPCQSCCWRMAGMTCQDYVRTRTTEKLILQLRMLYYMQLQQTAPKDTFFLVVICRFSMLMCVTVICAMTQPQMTYRAKTGKTQGKHQKSTVTGSVVCTVGCVWVQEASKEGGGL